MTENGDDISTLVALQTDRFTRIKQAIINFKKDSVGRKKQSYFVNRLNKSNEMYDKFITTHEELVSMNIDADHPYVKNNICTSFEESYFEYQNSLDDLRDELYPQVIDDTRTTSNLADNNNTSQGKSSTHIQFASIPTPVFSGKFIDWPSFSDAFSQLINDNPDLTNIQKFHYLKQALPTDSDWDLQNMLMTDDNYALAWELLRKRYNNPRIIFAHHMNVLYELPVLKTENADSIKSMLHTATICINEFKRLNIPIESCDHWITHYLCTKLPNETHKAWERHLGTDTNIPAYKVLEDFLTNRLFTIDAIEHRGLTHKSHNKHSPIENYTKPSTTKGQSRSKNSNSFHVKTQNQPKCVLCTQNHIIRRCPIFLSKDCFERKSIADTHKLCINCLSNTHTLTQCVSAKNCAQCGQRHHTLLHFTRNNTLNIDQSQFQPGTTHVQPSTSANSNQIQNAHNTILFSNHLHPNVTPARTSVLLATAMVTLGNPNTNQYGTFNALIDQGSEGTILSERVVQYLRLPRTKTFTSICGVGENASTKSKYIVNIHVLPQLNIVLPSQRVEPQQWSHIQQLPLADPTYYKPKKIDIIIGADVYPDIILPEIKTGQKNQPIAQNSQLGWIISGKTNTIPCYTVKIQCHTTLVELENLVQKFYESEATNTESTLSTQDEWCENYFKTTHIRQSNGKYQVRLPLKSKYDPNQYIGTSKTIALTRFAQLERRLKRDAQLSKQYTDAIEDYFTCNQIQSVTSMPENTYSTDGQNTVGTRSCVLPHHAVIKEESLTTKVRIVFDASAKTSNGRSLNDILCTGRPLQNDLTAVLLNWRLRKYVFLADIKKMYRCIDMHPADAHYQRILWRNVAGDIQEYCLTTVTFGTASAPFTAIRVLHQLADDERHRFPLASEILKNDIYVDDVLCGGDTIETTNESRKQLVAALRTAGMELRKWSSNHSSLLMDIPVEHQTTSTTLPLNDKNTVKTLGLNWNPHQDTLTFHINFDIPANFTKRSILSSIARLFDPLGLITPVTITAKLILKEIWNLKIDDAGKLRTLEWDEEIPGPVTARWKKLINDITTMNAINIPRWVNFLSTSQQIELHAFCDGSSTSYAATVYLRIQQTSRINTHLIIAKSRVIPNKPLTIPRIELCGAVLSINLITWVKRHIRGVKQNIPTFYWTDASIVLYWIQGEPERWQTYVSNRVKQILCHSSPHQWGHVESTQNPADCGTRGLTPTELSKFDLWWHGPSWLSQPCQTWQQQKFVKPEFKQNDLEEKVSRLHVHLCTPEESLILRYSSFTKLIRIHAWMYRFFRNCKERSKSPHLTLTVNELHTSLLLIVKTVQRETFGAEIHALQHNLPMPAKGKLNSLVPFLDNENILRIKGRLEHSSLSWSQKHPIILTSNHHFTNLVIDNEHLNTLHGGAQLTLTKIRQRFWILNARKTVRNRIRRCIRCFKQNPHVVTQLMGDLPSQRVVPPTRPFMSTGVDYTGSIELKSSRHRGSIYYKGYIAIFICLATKAIHLEAVTGLTTQHFLWALYRFIGRRGLCRDIYSDNGTNFTGANALLQVSPTEISNELSTRGIQWHFTPPHSPTFGGLWEANVKATKHHLKRVIGEGRLTYEELATVLVRIEACLNSRPLCPLTSDPEDLAVLTPAHFLITDSLLASPDVNSQCHLKSTSLTNQFFELQRMVCRFWTCWSSDWLSHLQSRPKWRRVEPNLQINELVIVKEDNIPPNQWKLGRKIHPGNPSWS